MVTVAIVLAACAAIAVVVYAYRKKEQAVVTAAELKVKDITKKL
jgi:hypothetical protein